MGFSNWNLLELLQIGIEIERASEHKEHFNVPEMTLSSNWQALKERTEQGALSIGMVPSVHLRHRRSACCKVRRSKGSLTA